MKKLSIFNLGNNVSSGVYFRLKDNREKAVITFLINNIDEVELDLVHPVKLADGREVNVKCVAELDNDLKVIKDTCPLCGEGFKMSEKVAVNVYNHTTKSVQIWQLGKTLIEKLIFLAEKRPDLINHTYEVTRLGAKGDTNTSYEFEYLGASDKKVFEGLDLIKKNETVYYEVSNKDLENFLITGDEKIFERNK
ncbi:single strand DNA binding protein [Clostridium phage phi24R]|uniref:Uncharacterized protein n=1 Tax=Clostridium phage phi24R TaxID=1128071 RepID=G9J3H4_9CAUD|nr:single strand DNA binding protein [Clostridium phage phi24R]AEW47839.1 hypothetical protein phi24R_gp7 [Clostridium phage phi24R]